MSAAIQAALTHDVAGDPITGVRWTRRTTEKIATELATLGIQVCPRTVARILKHLGYRLRVNHKRVSAGSGPDRDEQFQHIAAQRLRFAERGLPIISIDTKKRELVGNFKNHGTTWERSPHAVNDHDFRSQADGIAIPYGIYDLSANRGFVVVGTSHDTPDFAADNLLLLVAGRRTPALPPRPRTAGARRLRRQQLSAHSLLQVCPPDSPRIDPHRLKVTVCHYPKSAAPPSGIRSIIACSVRSARTGPVCRCATMRPSSTTSTPPPVFGRLDCAFNNAGVGSLSRTHEYREEDWDRVIGQPQVGCASRGACSGKQ